MAQIEGDNQDNFLVGTSGADTILGLGGDDDLAGLEGPDLLKGGKGDDTLLADQGNDTLIGGAGVDAVGFALATSGVNASLMKGTATGGSIGNDKIKSVENLIGSSFNDALRGDDGANVLDGATGRDKLFGNRGRDELLGGVDKDTLVGGGGQDTLYGEAGNDRLKGGIGADEFQYGPLGGKDTIVDFKDGTDVIELLAMGVLNVSEIKQMATNNNGNLVIDFGNGNVLTLLDFLKKDLDSSDFSFIS